jgi:hypothetical protein
LRDRNKVQKLVQSVDPLVRAVDGIAGEHVSMRVSSLHVSRVVLDCKWPLPDQTNFVSLGRFGLLKWSEYYWIIYS